jgi:hypothetical protein
MNTPEGWEKMRRTMATPEFKAKRSRISREVHNRPGMKERKSAKTKKTMADPMFRARRAAVKP